MVSNERNLFDSIQELKEEYSMLLKEALKESLIAIKKAVKSKKTISSHINFPTLSFRRNGLPEISTTLTNGPKDYRNCFYSFFGEPIIDEKKLSSFNKLASFVKSHSDLHSRFLGKLKFPPIGDRAISLDEVFIFSGVKDIVEFYIHNFETIEYEENKAKAAIVPTISYIFDKDLSIEICTPILFLRFPFDDYQISEGISIKRISREQQLARFNVKSFNTSVHDVVLSSATHALVFKNWSVQNSEAMLHFDILKQPRAYPIELIDQFFAALRIVSSFSCGYGQIYSIANGWQAECKANLPYMQGFTIRSYPSHFEDYCWNAEEIPSISLDLMGKIKNTYSAILSAKENSIRLSINRLNRCFIRDHEEDMVLDATIALEALLSDGNQEMTHKLAMRIGALARFDSLICRTPKQAFQDIKKIYSFRSAIVHGSKNVEKSRMIKIEPEKVVPAENLAIDYLRMVLRILLENPSYREPNNIDELLLRDNG